MSAAGALASINQGLKRGSDKGANEVRSGLDAAGPVGSSSPIRGDVLSVAPFMSGVTVPAVSGVRGEEENTQPASPATLQASRDALAAALGGPLRREVLEGYPVSVFDGTGASRMDVDVTKSRTAEEAALPPPMDSPTKRRVSSDVVPEYDLTEHDEDRKSVVLDTDIPSDHDELQDASGGVGDLTAVAGSELRQSLSPDFGRLKEHNVSALHPPHFAGEVAANSAANSEFGAEFTDRGARRSPRRINPPNKAERATVTDASPSWLPDLQASIQRLSVQQEAFLHEMTKCTAVTQEHRSCISTLQKRSEAHERLHTEHEGRISRIERELAELKSRGPSPATPRGGGFTPRSIQGSTTASSAGGRLVDDLQIVIGGFVNAKRADLQAELRSFFEQHGGPEVLKEVFVPYLRSNITRLELNFPGEADLRQRRLIQTQVLEVLKTNYTRSTIPGQESNNLWIQRNRSPEDRQMIRSILRTKDILQSLSPASSCVEFEWRGRVYLDGHNVLFHTSQKSVSPNHFPLSDAKGSHNGWWIDTGLVSRLLGRGVQEVEDRCQG